MTSIERFNASSSTLFGSGIGDMLVVSEIDEAMSLLRGSMGPWIVADLDQVKRILNDAGAQIINAIEPAPTAQMLFVEVSRRAGRLSSQMQETAGILSDRRHPFAKDLRIG